MPSTLHLFWDLFGMLGKQPVSIYLDEGAYPIARWGAERAAACGVAVRRFRHHDPDSLLAQIAGQARSRKRPVVVADGFCPACGGPAPIGDYLDIVRRFGGLLVLDDTQALGILGEEPGAHAPYGNGGGGVLRWSGHFGPDILVGASLAKGFGVPVAALAGSELMLRRFATLSDTRVHCSPPSAALISAAERALAINEGQGDRLRSRLLRLVGGFRKRLRQIGLSACSGFFPVQTLKPMPRVDAVQLHERLLGLGIRTVLHRARNGQGPRLSFQSRPSTHPQKSINAWWHYSRRALSHAADAEDKTMNQHLAFKQEPFGMYPLRVAGLPFVPIKDAATPGFEMPEILADRRTAQPSPQLRKVGRIIILPDDDTSPVYGEIPLFYRGDDPDLFLGKFLKTVGKAAKSVGGFAWRMSPVGQAVTWGRRGVDAVKAVARGERIDRVFRKLGQAGIADVRERLKIAEMVAPFIPGVGTGVAAALGAANALASGKPITEAVLSAARSAIPGGKIVQAGFDVAMNLARGKTFVGVGTIRSPVSTSRRPSYAGGL